MTNNTEIEIPKSASLAIIELGSTGPAVAYYLGKHPEICEELMGMRPLTAVGKIHEIARSLNPEKAASPKPKAKVTPPAPLAPVGGSSSRSSTPLDQLSPAEYIRVRNKQEAMKRR